MQGNPSLLCNIDAIYTWEATLCYIDAIYSCVATRQHQPVARQRGLGLTDVADVALPQVDLEHVHEATLEQLGGGGVALQVEKAGCVEGEGKPTFEEPELTRTSLVHTGLVCRHVSTDCIPTCWYLFRSVSAFL